MRVLSTKRLVLSVVLLAAAGWSAHGLTPPPGQSPVTEQVQELPQRFQRGGQGPSLVYKAQITPHWLPDSTRFWYRNDLSGGAREFILVNAGKGMRGPAFDHGRLAAGLAKAAGKDYRADALPFTDIEFVEEGRALRFRADATTWTCDLKTYVCTRAATPTPSKEAPAAGPVEEEAPLDSLWPDGLAPEAGLEPAPQRQGAPSRAESARSPDGKWTVIVKDHNLFLQPLAGGADVQLSTDGREGLAYGLPHWSPDSRTLVAYRIEPGDRKEVHLVESSPAGGGRAQLRSRPYALPGDRFTSYELNVFAVEGRKQQKPAVERVDFGTPRPRWKRDGRHFTYEKVDRGHQRFRLIEVDSLTGSVRNVIDEKAQTFIWTAHVENIGMRPVTYLDATDEYLHASG